MRDSMANADPPPPAFKQTQVGTHHVHVTLKNNSEHRRTFLSPNVAELVGTAFYDTLTEHEKLCLNFVSETGKISVSDAMRLIQRDWHAAKAILEGLVERRVLELRRKSGKDRESSKRYFLRSTSRK